MNPMTFLTIILVTALYVLSVVGYLTSHQDTPMWTWPALAAPILLALAIILFAIYNVFLFLATILGV